VSDYADFMHEYAQILTKQVKEILKNVDFTAFLRGAYESFYALFAATHFQQMPILRGFLQVENFDIVKK